MAAIKGTKKDNSSVWQKKEYIRMMITSVKIENFKALKDFSFSLKDFNILVGQNNNGKSTILDTFRILNGAYRYASRFKPSYVNIHDGKTKWGYKVPQSSIPINLINVQSDYSEDPTIITYYFGREKKITIILHNEGDPKLIIESVNKLPKTAKDFRREFPLNLVVIPPLGPLEIEEEIRLQDYVKRWGNSPRAPRLFRNIWYYDNSGFEEFRELVESTWPGMSIEIPERIETFSRQLAMFCNEDRITREVGWLGFGFQIWLQLLTHIIKAKDADLIVVDEPEIYLHPDLQHKIIDILKSFNSKILIATHSVEIINDVPPSEVLLVDKTKKSAKRITDLIGLQNVANIIGSTQNIHLTRLAKGKKVLFVEGLDRKLLGRFAQKVNLSELFESGELTTIPINRLDML